MKKREAKPIAQTAFEEICSQPKGEIKAFSLACDWSPWFFDVAWDSTLVVFNLTAKKMWLICGTDTD